MAQTWQYMWTSGIASITLLRLSRSSVRKYSYSSESKYDTM